MKWLFQPFTQFLGSPSVVSILLLKDTIQQAKFYIHCQF